MDPSERDGAQLSIGVFARRSRLSVKALRLYEQLGLLVPASVDGANGYRRYTEDQLATARLVALLRGLDMPLARVSEVVAAPRLEAARLVSAYWESVEASMASRRALAAHLRTRLLDEGSLDMYEIRTREVPEQLVLTEQRHLTVQQLQPWLESVMGRLARTAEEHGGIVGSAFVIFHGQVDEDNDGPVEVCFPIAMDREGSSDAAARREPAHEEAYARLRKAQVAYPQILSAYDAVSEWIGAHGRKAAGAPREVYFVDFDAAGPEDEVCDVACPVE